MQTWLNAELLRIRGWHIRRLHGLALIAVLVAAAILLVALGVFVGTHFPYKTLPAPPVPKGQVAPSCGTDASSQVNSTNDHVHGQCLPYPKAAPPAGIRRTGALDLIPAAYTTGITGPDLSNNDPVYSSASWNAIRARSRFVYVKSIEGTGFHDSTARTMADAAKARGIPVGGYDFQHVCGVSASAEAAFFVRTLRAQGLLGPGTLPPAADSEYGSGSCGGRSWLQTWTNTVYNLDGHVCPIDYTGAWWWQPNIGSFWPTCQGRQLLTWISGYGVSYPYMPSGVSHLDFWQFSDHGYNGASYADLSAWQHGDTTFASFAHATPVVPADKYRILDRTVRDLGHGVRASERGTITTWDTHRCLHPARRGVCVSSRNHARLLVARIDRVSCHTAPAGFGVSGCSYRRLNRRSRRAWLSRVGAS